MSKNIILFSKDDLRELILETLQQYGQPQQIEPIEGNDSLVKTRKEFASDLHISLVTLNTWVKEGRVPKPKKIGKRVYFLKQDITDFLLSQDLDINLSKSPKKG